MTLENTKNDGERPSPTGPNAPSQVVIVQQSPPGENRDTVTEFIKEVLGTDQGGGPPPEHQQARKMVLTLSSHNLLVVIALLILAGGQITNVILQASQSKKSPEPSRQQDIDLSIVLSAEAIQKALADAQQAAASAHEDAGIAQRAVFEGHSPAGQQLDPNLARLITAALDRNYPQVSPSDMRVVITPVPIQTAGPLVPQTAPDSATIHHGVFRLATIKITPSLVEDPTQKFRSLTDKQSSTLGPLNVSADYKSDERAPLMLLNANAFLTASDRNSGTEGIAGVCPLPQIIGKVPINGSGHHEDFTLTLSEGWTPADRRAAKEAWDNEFLYLTFCTAYELDDAGPVLNRQVFRVMVEPGTKTRRIEAGQRGEDFLNVALQ